MSAAPNVAFSAALVDELIRSGVRHACVCPGSRSSPLAIVIAERVDLRTWMHVDERSAAFFALGLARQLREPVVLLCSSGTAGANMFPAVIEAALGRVPLIVLTADRPAELRDIGAPQTIDQVALYGRYAKWFVDVPAPDALPAPATFARTTAARAVVTAISAPWGPVHCNVQFREPLLARAERAVELVPIPIGAPRTVAGTLAPPAHALRALAAELAASRRGAIVCGPQDDPAFPAAVARLAAALDVPLFADALSQVRCGPHDRSHVVDAYDVFLRDAATRAQFTPDWVLRFGALPTSKVLWELLETHGGLQILVDDAGSWRDPLATATRVLHADTTLVADELAALLEPARADANPWCAAWFDLDARTARALSEAIGSDEAIFEGRALAEIAAALPDGATLVVGNSMPVRDLDAFVRGNDRPIRFAANRGANGIDGVVSTALGAAAAGDPVVLAIGDLSFYHDSNGLLATLLNGVKATIVVLNNDGGGIFSFLPQATIVAPDRFEQVLGTPTGIDPARIAAVYGATFVRPDTWTTFRTALRDAANVPGCTIIELRTERAENVRRHRAVWATVRAALDAPVLPLS